jgi:hypothetical protein
MRRNSFKCFVATPSQPHSPLLLLLLPSLLPLLLLLLLRQ